MVVHERGIYKFQIVAVDENGSFDFEKPVMPDQKQFSDGIEIAQKAARFTPATPPRMRPARSR